jgi:hypothetical protein
MADDRGRGRRRYRERRRLMPTPLGCAIWIIALLVLLVILSVLFGGFQLGTRAGSPGPARSLTMTAVSRD